MSFKLIKVTYCEGCEVCEFVKDSHVIGYQDVSEDMNTIFSFIVDKLKAKGHIIEAKITYNRKQTEELKLEETGDINAKLN